VYDSTKILHPEFVREDITYIGIPMMEICLREYSDPKATPVVQKHDLRRRLVDVVGHGF